MAQGVLEVTMPIQARQQLVLLVLAISLKEPIDRIWLGIAIHLCLIRVPLRPE